MKEQLKQKSHRRLIIECYVILFKAYLILFFRWLKYGRWRKSLWYRKIRQKRKEVLAEKTI